MFVIVPERKGRQTGDPFLDIQIASAPINLSDSPNFHLVHIDEKGSKTAGKDNA